MGQRSDRWAREHAWLMGSTLRSLHEKAEIHLLADTALLDEARQQFRCYADGTLRGMFSAPDRDVYMEAFVAAYTGPGRPAEDDLFSSDQTGETNDYKEGA